MVEGQQSVKTVLSFGAKSVEPEILESLLIGRDKSADYLDKAIEAIVHNGNTQQILVVGQRGMGKTHLIRVLYHRCQKYLQTGQLKVAYFSEEEYGVANYFDFLTRVLYAFIRWNQKDEAFLKDKLEELQNTNNAGQIPFLEKIIQDYIGDTPLIILAENFGDILNSLGKQQGKLRAWLYANKKVSIIATTQSLSDDFEKEDRPFYGFFNQYYLKALNYKESINFLISLARLDNREDVVEHLKGKGRGQVRAIYELVKGNHRLLVTFYEFLKSDTLAKISEHFIKTINDLKPYYEKYIRYLPPQQQKIIRYIALARTPQQGVSISKNCFIDQKSLSKQISELVRKKLLEVITDKADKRNKLYDINEPLLRISIEIGEHKEGITALFIDFLALCYNENELVSKKVKFTDLLESCDNLFEKKNFLYEIEAIEKALQLKKTLGGANLSATLFEQLKQLSSEDLVNGYSLIEQERNNLTTDAYYYYLSFLYVREERFDEIIKFFPKISREFIEKNKIYRIWAYSLFRVAVKSKDLRLYEQALLKFKKAFENQEQDSYLYFTWADTLGYYGALIRKESFVIEAFNKIKMAINLNDKDYKGYLNLAKWQSALAMLENNDAYIDDSINNFRISFELNPRNVQLFTIWGGAISFSYREYSRFPEVINVFNGGFVKLDIGDRIKCWKSFSKLNQLSFFAEMFSLLKEDTLSNPVDISPLLIGWVNNILSNHARDLKKEDLGLLRNLIGDLENEISELKITMMYIETIQSYVLDGDENAIYALPKEQRLFFENNILKSPSE